VDRAPYSLHEVAYGLSLGLDDCFHYQLAPRIEDRDYHGVFMDIHTNLLERIHNPSCLNRTTRHSYTQAASRKVSSCEVFAASSASTAAVTSGV
jgi:hypothetical protein